MNFVTQNVMSTNVYEEKVQLSAKMLKYPLYRISVTSNVNNCQEDKDLTMFLLFLLHCSFYIEIKQLYSSSLALILVSYYSEMFLGTQLM